MKSDAERKSRRASRLASAKKARYYKHQSFKINDTNSKNQKLLSIGMTQ